RPPSASPWKRSSSAPPKNRHRNRHLSTERAWCYQRRGRRREALQGDIIGIDLGTTNSCAAIVEDDGNVKIIPYRGGETTIPSIFAIDDKGNELVGYEAKRQWLLNPRRTVYGAKRLVGRDYQEGFVKKMG